MKKEVFYLDEEKKVCLSAYLWDESWEMPDIPKRPAVLVLPGGGYEYCSDREADPVAFSYMQAGYHAFVLRYTVGKEIEWPAPLLDYDKAMDLIIKHAAEWNLYDDKIAVVGFSAGGHLAASAATMAQHRPAAAILAYPVITGECAESYCEKAPDVALAVDRDTCPCFLTASCSDTIVPIENTIAMINALEKNNISFESHIYSHGTHGFSVVNSGQSISSVEVTSRTNQWVENSISWLKDVLGDFGEGEMLQPICTHYANPNREPMLSSNCNIGIIVQNAEAKAIAVEALNKAFAPHTYEQMADNIQGMSLKSILRFNGVPNEEIQNMERSLEKIKNPNYNNPNYNIVQKQLIENYKILNKKVRKKQILFTGSSLMEQFPICEIAQSDGLNKVLYNRGVSGYKTEDFLKEIDTMLFDLDPAKVFINIGTNDMNSDSDNNEGWMERLLYNYEKILVQMKNRIPDATVYMMAYYPVNRAMLDSMNVSIFNTRTNENIAALNKKVKQLADKYEYTFIDVNEGLCDEQGNLKEEYTKEGVHMYANAYQVVYDNLKKYIEE